MNNVKQTWADMGQRLAIALPRWVINRLDQQGESYPFVVKAIPVVIVLLSIASIETIRTRVEYHHSAWQTPAVAAGVAILVPLATLAAALIRKRNWAILFWVVSFVVASISGAIQYGVYVVDNATIMQTVEAIAFGFGIPFAEVLFAIMEAVMIKQWHEDRAAAEHDTAEAERVAEQQAQADAEHKASIAAAAQKAAEDREFERSKREAELQAYKAKLLQDAEFERERLRVELRIKEQKAAAKFAKPEAANDSDGDSDESKLIRFYALNPMAPQREAADATGMNQSKVNRILKRLESDEVIHRNGNGVEILHSL